MLPRMVQRAAQLKKSVAAPSRLVPSVVAGSSRSSSSQPGLYSFEGIKPKVHETAYVAPTASVIGEVDLQKDTSVWFGATIRGDSGVPMVIGEGSNIQVFELNF